MVLAPNCAMQSPSCVQVVVHSPAARPACAHSSPDTQPEAAQGSPNCAGGPPLPEEHETTRKSQAQLETVPSRKMERLVLEGLFAESAAQPAPFMKTEEG
jgi:hypothetical protein